MVDLRTFEIIWVDEAEHDLEALPISLQGTAVRKLEQAVQRNFKTADRLMNWQGEYRRIRIDDNHRLVFFVDREQSAIIVLSIDLRDKVYEPPNQQHVNKLLEQALEKLGLANPLLKIGRIPEQKIVAPPENK